MLSHGWRRRCAIIGLAGALTGLLGSTVAHARGDGPLARAARNAGREAGDDAGDALIIGVGVTTGVLALVGGAIWYYFHNRNQAAATTAGQPAGTAETSAR
jgi:hypothetical protein